MEHSFNIDVATVYGVNAAIILNNLEFWIAKNKANEKHYHDGYYWTYNSTKALSELFPYLTKKKIEAALGLLRDDGIIITGNYNSDKRDRSLWYAITEKGEELLKRENALPPQGKCKLPAGEMHVTNKGNACSPQGTPLPDINTDINTDIKPDEKETYNCEENQPENSKQKKPSEETIIQEERFNRFWECYPRKIKRKNAEKAWEKISPNEELTEKIIEAVNNAKKHDYRFKEEKYTPHPATWLNGMEWENQFETNVINPDNYIDYENYVPTEDYRLI
jgi:DNA-binding PadR family transcriptional regulator